MPQRLSQNQELREMIAQPFILAVPSLTRRVSVIGSEAKQSILRQEKNGLLRRFAPLRKRFAFVAGNDGALIGDRKYK